VLELVAVDSELECGPEFLPFNDLKRRIGIDYTVYDVDGDTDKGMATGSAIIIGGGPSTRRLHSNWPLVNPRSQNAEIRLDPM
jgi:hypothetical protein